MSEYIMELNDNWAVNFLNEDKLYQEYYKDDNYYSNLNFLYVNRENEIERVLQEKFLFSSANKITKEELLGILKNHMIENNKQYKLLGILKYNITLEPTDIRFFLKNDIESNFLSVIKNIDEILFERSINSFQDLNDVIFILYEKLLYKHQDKEKIQQNINYNTTKKIYLYSNTNKKTIKKRYKD